MFQHLGVLVEKLKRVESDFFRWTSSRASGGI